MVIIRPDVALLLVNSDRKSFYKLQTFFILSGSLPWNVSQTTVRPDNRRRETTPRLLLIILEDLSRAKLTQELAKHQQNIKFPTRDMIRLNLFLNIDE